MKGLIYIALGSNFRFFKFPFFDGMVLFLEWSSAEILVLFFLHPESLFFRKLESPYYILDIISLNSNVLSHLIYPPSFY